MNVIRRARSLEELLAGTISAVLISDHEIVEAALPNPTRNLEFRPQSVTRDHYTGDLQHRRLMYLMTILVKFGSIRLELARFSGQAQTRPHTTPPLRDPSPAASNVLLGD